MTSRRNPDAHKNPPGPTSPRGENRNPDAPVRVSGWSGRGQQSHAPALSPSTSDPSTELNPVDQTAVVRCWSKKTLCEWLGISTRSWDRAAAAGLTPAADLVIGSSARWAPQTIAKWLRTRPVLPGRGRRHD